MLGGRGAGSFSGEIPALPALLTPGSGPPRRRARCPPAGMLFASTCVRGEPRAAGARAVRGGMPCVRAGVCVPAALQWQLPSRRLLTLALQCSRS